MNNNKYKNVKNYWQVEDFENKQKREIYGQRKDQIKAIVFSKKGTNRQKTQAFNRIFSKRRYLNTNNVFSSLQRNISRCSLDYLSKHTI